MGAGGVDRSPGRGQRQLAGDLGWHSQQHEVVRGRVGPRAFTEKWDVGPGEHGDFPAKWMSADGRELHLVLSGDDAFCVRRATLTLRCESP